MNREIVARIFNPLYRRFVIGRVGKSWALGLSDAPQNSIYSRVQPALRPARVGSWSHAPFGL